MALGAAKHGGETADLCRIHQRGIGGTEFLGDDNRALGEVGKRLERHFHEGAQQPIADIAHILYPGRQIVVLHVGEGLGNPRQLVGHRRLGVDGVPGDAPVDPAHQARTAEHQGVSVEQVAEFLGRVSSFVGFVVGLIAVRHFRG